MVVKIPKAPGVTIDGYTFEALQMYVRFVKMSDKEIEISHAILLPPHLLFFYYKKVENFLSIRVIK